MNELQVFNSPEFGEIRAVEVDGEPWFVAADVCRALDIQNSRDALSRLDEDEKGVVSTDTPGGEQKVNIVNEPGLYALVLGSRKPEAKAFKRWLTHEVIPAIRKTGAYIAPQTASANLDAAALQAFTAAMDTLSTMVQTLAQRLDAMEQRPRPQLPAAPGKPLNNKFRRQWMQTASQKLNALADECGLPSTTVLHNIYGEMEMELDISLPEVRLKAVEEHQLSDCSYLLAIFYDDALRKWFVERMEAHLTEANPFW